MNKDINVLEIMEKTIDSLKANKETVITIIKNLQDDLAQKKLELESIQKKLPEAILETNRLRILDKQLRKQLMLSSGDFSDNGHLMLKAVFEQTSEIHNKLFIAEETEQRYVQQRNTLEMELKKIKCNIEIAENMMHHLIASLSYLQLGVSNLTEQNGQLLSEEADPSYVPILTAFKCIEDEKSRVARDLHDGPVQRIASVQMRMDFCKTAVTMDLDKGLALLDNLKQDLACTLSEVRDILFDLNPAPLEKLGLKYCIEHLLTNLSEKINIKCQLTYTVDAPFLNMSMQNTIYRIVQELLNNIKKHAHASSIILKLASSDNFIYITLADNGIGFEVPDDFETMRLKNKSYGLFNIHTRIKNLNGILKVDSQPDKGSCFQIQLPILSF